MNRRHINRLGISLLASAALHGGVLLIFLYTLVNEPANNISLQGNVAALTIHMVSFSPAEPNPDDPVEHTSPLATLRDDKLPPLPDSERGQLQQATTKKSVRKKKIPSQNKPLIAHAKPKNPPTAKAGQSTNLGRDQQESEAGRAAATTRQSMIGTGIDEKATYSARLRSEIESHKHYPLRARQARAGGVVRVRFNVEDDGRLTHPQLASSSGNRELDNAALQAVRQSNAIGPRPPQFSRSVSVNINFVLKNR